MENKEENIKKLIIENSHFFWWVPEDKKKNLSIDSLIEAVLNYGNENSVKKLFDVIGIKQVAAIFYKQINSIRCNYYPQTKNFFNLYFQRHAH
jgi:hypothetical protein